MTGEDRPGRPITTPYLGESTERRFGRRVVDLGTRPLVMAIVNRTRDSFFDGGRTFGLETAVAAALAAAEAGADWIDIGAVPFSPLTEPVSEAQEIARVVPVVEAIRQESDVIISVDTFRSGVASRVLAAGADVVNDTSGLSDPDMAAVVAQHGAAAIITHSLARPRQWLDKPSYQDVVSEVVSFLQERVARALNSGMAPQAIVVDPGHDLNKNTFHSLAITRDLSRFAGLGYPLLVSVSNKDFISEVLDRPKQELQAGTVATLMICLMQGARIVRVHDVPAAVSAVQMFESVFGDRRPPRPRHNL